MLIDMLEEASTHWEERSINPSINGKMAVCCHLETFVWNCSLMCDCVWCWTGSQLVNSHPWFEGFIQRSAHWAGDTQTLYHSSDLCSHKEKLLRLSMWFTLLPWWKVSSVSTQKMWTVLNWGADNSNMTSHLPETDSEVTGSLFPRWSSCHGSVSRGVLYLISMPSCVLSVSPVFFRLCMFVSLCLSVFCPLCFPSRYLTWPPPSSLSSPVPRLIVSVCVFSLCFPSCLCPFMASVWCLSLSDVLPEFLVFPRMSPSGMCFFGFWFLRFWFELFFLFACCSAVLALVATLLLSPFVCVLYQAYQAKLAFCFSLILSPV